MAQMREIALLQNPGARLTTFSKIFSKEASTVEPSPSPSGLGGQLFLMTSAPDIPGQNYFFGAKLWQLTIDNWQLTIAHCINLVNCSLWIVHRPLPICFLSSILTGFYNRNKQSQHLFVFSNKCPQTIGIGNILYVLADQASTQLHCTLSRQSTSYAWNPAYSQPVQLLLSMPRCRTWTRSNCFDITNSFCSLTRYL